MKFLWHPKALAIALVLTASCSQSDSQPTSKGDTASEKMTAEDLFAKTQIGMTRADVEKLLGKPVLPEIAPNRIAWYLSPPKIEVHQSPFAPGSVGIRFVGGKVAERLLNPQCEKPPIKEQ